jgi:hypothetical protein
METLVTFPLTSHRRVADWPRWIEVGSTLNCATVGAAGFGASGAGAGAGGGGGGGGAFFLQPAANIAKDIETATTVNVLFFNMSFFASYRITSPKRVSRFALR